MHNSYWEEQALMYVTGDLDSQQQQAFEDHLKDCDQCQDDVGEWHAIAGASQSHFQAIPIQRQRSRWLVELPFAAAIVLVIALGLIFVDNQLQPDDPNTGASSSVLQTTETMIPTDVATMRPSIIPTGAMFVTNMPTLIPREYYLTTVTPTLAPTETMLATGVPTGTPTLAPTLTATLWETEEVDDTDVAVETPEPYETEEAMETAEAYETEEPIDDSFTDGMFEFPPSAMLDVERISFVNQGFNQSGLATLGMGLSYYNSSWSLDPIAAEMQHYVEDPNTSPQELVDFTNTTAEEADAIIRVGGDLDVLHRLIASGYPVLVETGIDVETDDWLGHYRLVVGYDEESIIVYDSNYGRPSSPSIVLSNEQFIEEWWQFSNVFIVLYPPHEYDSVVTLLGYLQTETEAYRQLIMSAQEHSLSNANDLWSLFNLGDAFTVLGEYEIAAGYFRTAYGSLGLPERLTWYRHSPFEAFYQVEDYEALDELVSSNLATRNSIEEFHYYQGLLYLVAQDDKDAAIEEFNLALDLRASYDAAQDALNQLEANEE